MHKTKGNMRKIIAGLLALTIMVTAGCISDGPA